MKNIDTVNDIGQHAADKFRTRLIDWHREHNNRSLPWKGIKDPYKIWLSEVILQQTRAAQGLPYYQKFIEAWPDVMALACADDEDVFRVWQGLGYYSRCKNMLATARIIAGKYKGKFPDNYEEILALKGIGNYTAAAISSFAYGLPHAVVDGNVYRILSRYFGISESIDSTRGRKVFAHVAQQMLYVKDSAAHNQAMMDLGATVCMPARPNCSICPLQTGCYAAIHDVVGTFPVRTKKIHVRNRHFTYIILECDNHIWLRKRGEGDIWENLYEPYLIEHGEPATMVTENACKIFNITSSDATIEFLSNVKQRLTHQLIFFSFYRLVLNEKLPIDGGNWVSTSQLEKLAFPKTVVSFFRKNLYF